MTNEQLLVNSEACDVLRFFEGEIKRCWQPKKVPRKKHSRNAALHPDFYDKVNLWKELLKNEVAADVQEVRDLLINPLADDLERLSQISGPFKLRTNCLHALHGRILVLIHEKSDIHKTMARMSLRPGAPVMLCKFPNLVSISDCIVISCSEVEVVLKAKTTDLDISISDQLVVVPSSGLGYLTALNEFLCSQMELCINQSSITHYFLNHEASGNQKYYQACKENPVIL
ncbi:unnamed protein product [Thelazia callipaeda]|uniref:Ribosomal_L7Ae domain-containing protein n=1 Tax=Thelazia callipaeda TaxID=103827 RepID=A0A0N5CRX2_THECL|nr:unnamed protein product [Thelazia callipaeda]